VVAETALFVAARNRERTIPLMSSGDNIMELKGLLERYTDGKVDGPAFQQEFFPLFSSGGFHPRCLHDMFWAAEDYVEDPSLRGPHELDDHGLLKAARKCHDELHAFLRDGPTAWNCDYWVWTGGSATSYTYIVHSIADVLSSLQRNFRPIQSNFIFTRMDRDGKWLPIHIGQGNLESILGDRNPRWPCIMAKGATHVHTGSVDALEIEREKEVADLLAVHVQAYCPDGCSEIPPDGTNALAES